jgi:RHS repeat-associated protein
MGQECNLPPPDKDSCHKSGDPPGTCSSPSAGNPIYIGSGTKIEPAVDYSDPQGLTFVRTYRSNRVGSGPTGFAGGTFSNFHLRLVSNTTRDHLYAYREDGSVLMFTVTGGVVQGDADIADRIATLFDGSGNPNGWSYYRASNEDAETYDRDGRLISILHRNGQLVQLTYRSGVGDAYPDGAPTCTTTPPDYVVNGTFAPWCVTDAFGRQLNFDYDDQGRLSRFVDPAGQSTVYEYNGLSAPYPNVNGPTLSLLTKVTYPDLSSRTYTYDEPANSLSATHGLLTGISDEKGVRYATFRYDASGNATDTLYVNNVNHYQLAGAGAGSVSVTDPLGTSRTYTFSTLLGAQRNTGITQPLPGGGTVSQSLGYDANGNINSKTDFNGATTTYHYDLVRNLEINRVENAGTASQRTVVTSWNPGFRVPTQRTVTNASAATEAFTSWAYNTRGQAIARCEADPAVAGASSYVCGSSPNAPAGVRQSTTAYCESADLTAGTCPVIGLVKSTNGPRAPTDPGMSSLDDTTTYTYYQTDDVSCLLTAGTCAHRHGDLWKVTNALGQVTTYVTYDKNGRVTRMQDANGTYTDFLYHARGWLTDRIVRASATGAAGLGDATTHVDYDAVGNVIKVTQPDGAFLAYTYDDAHRLIKITDASSNTIDYCPGGVGSASCLDAAGNRLIEQVKDASGTLKRSLHRSYNQLSQLIQITNAASTPVEHSNGLSDTGVADGYDGNGNRVLVQDGFGTTTKQSYDGLNRLVATIQNYNGTDFATANTTTQYTYDTRDNLRQVTDPDGDNTVYTYDGLNNLTHLTSPDTGGTSYVSDKAGNRISQTDNRGTTSTYTYDALNRLSAIAYPTTSLNVAYAYDESNATTGCGTSYPTGRLTRMTDGSGSTTYCYDRRGNVTQKKQVMGTATLTTQYGYTVADRLASITYPSGAVATYTRDAVGRVKTVTWKSSGITTTIVSNATYYPFGPLNVLTWGNGRTLTKTYDQDYAIDTVASSAASGLKLDLGVDVMGDITHASGSIAPTTPDRSYAYDPLYRLTTAQTGATPPTPLELYTYGKTGDRTSASLNGAAAQTYAYTAGTHRLASIAGATRIYDPNGNTQTGIGSATLSYDDRNRLSTAVVGTTNAVYLTNGRGERVSKAISIGGFTSAAPILYTYDESGQLLGDYTGATPQAEYVYLDGTPIAVVKSGTLSYIETDHLGTPRQVVNPATNTALWTWDLLASTFGTAMPNQSPGGGAAYTLNLRFPGQYYDAETGLNYNINRDYESGSARYVESDPIGMGGGINTYAYIQGNPLNMADPLGLQVGTAWGYWFYYQLNPPIPALPDHYKVLLCHRRADLPFPLNLANHYWFKTNRYESGMGGACAVPGQGCADWPYSPTVTKDHSGQSTQSGATCVEIPVDEQCTDSHIQPGQPTGPFAPWNNCQTFANGVIGQCTIGPPQ